MSKSRAMSMSLAIAALALVAPLHAQGRSAVTSAELEAAVVARPEGNRAVVQDFLANPQVQSVAGRMGISTTLLSASAATLDQAQVDQVAAQAGVRDLAGGDQKIIISTTVIMLGIDRSRP